MKAIILAAGAGTRLQRLTNGLPKCLVRFGSETLVQRQMRGLLEAGVNEFVVVTGHQAGKIRAHCGTSVEGATVSYIHNPEYASTNSICSLDLARQALDKDCFLVNCDIVFSSAIPIRMVSSGRDNTIAVDTRTSRLQGEMNVAFDAEGRVSEISKVMPAARACARSVQIAKFDASGGRMVAAEVGKLVKEGNSNQFPTSAYGPLIGAGHLFAIDAGDLPWAEIDSPQDYDDALEAVLPRL